MLKQKYCNLLNLCVRYYEYATGNNFTALALDSGLWHATVNGSGYRAYMLERYLDPKRIPNRFKMSLILKTSDWVLDNYDDKNKLRNNIINLKNEIENIMF